MTDLEQTARHLVSLAAAPTAVVVAPFALTDPQQLADELGVEVREWAGCGPDGVYIRSKGEMVMGTLVASPARPSDAPGPDAD